MKHIVIIGSKFGELCRELTAAFEKRGCEARFFAAQELCQSAGMGRPAAFEEADAAVIRGIPAGSLEDVIFRMDALYTEEMKGLPFVNSPKAIERTVDKFLTTALLEKNHIPVPPTICVPADAEMVRRAFYELGEDVIYKPIFGSCGSGLLRIRSEEAAAELAVRLKSEGRVAYLQKFIPCGDSDIRAFVLGGRVIAAMTRKGRDWRANLTLGGSAVRRALSADEEDLAVQAAEAVGADVAGVDMIRDKDDRLYAIEVNGCPGWRGLSEVTGVDAAGELADYVLRNRSGL